MVHATVAGVTLPTDLRDIRYAFCFFFHSSHSKLCSHLVSAIQVLRISTLFSIQQGIGQLPKVSFLLFVPSLEPFLNG